MHCTWNWMSGNHWQRRIPATKRAALCWAIDQALQAYASWTGLPEGWYGPTHYISGGSRIWERVVLIWWTEAHPATKWNILGGSGGMPPQKNVWKMSHGTEVHLGTFWKSFRSTSSTWYLSSQESWFNNNCRRVGFDLALSFYITVRYCVQGIYGI